MRKGSIMRTLLIGGALLCASMPVQAATIIVDATANSRNGGSAYNFGTVIAGRAITVTSSTDDLWSAGDLPRFSDGNGLVAPRFATGSDESGQPVGTQIGMNFGSYSFDGFSAPYGALVGRIGSTYQLLGANFSGTTWGTGNLELFYWDSNNGDNFGDIAFNVTVVPEPEVWALMILGFGVAGAALRRRKPRLAITPITA